MDEKIQKLFLIDNLFFDRLNDVDNLLHSLLSSFNHANVTPLTENSEIVFVNNNNTKWDDKVLEYKVKIVNSIEEIDFLKYNTVLYSNNPFFSVATAYNDIVVNTDVPKNTIITQKGFNLSPMLKSNDKRFLFVEAKPGQTCNLSILNVFAFKPAEIEDKEYKFKTQKDLVQFLHSNRPVLTFNYYNIAGVSPFSLMDTEEEYINFCLSPDYVSKEDMGTIGTYAVFFPDDLTVDDVKNVVVELIDNNPKMVIDIRTSLDISDIFEEKIEEIDGEFVVQNSFDGDVSRIITSNKDMLHYDFNVINGTIDLSDRHIRHLVMGTPKYMKIYNSGYTPLYRIEKSDLESAKRIAVKRTMGMGDALLTLPIIRLLKLNYPHLEIDFYSKYNFKDYMKHPDDISKYHKLGDDGIFNHVDGGEYDIVLDFDLAYENQTDGGRFYDYYMSLFGEKTFDEDLTDEPILHLDAVDLGNTCVIVAEGSGWGGKEPNIDIFERVAYEMKQKKFHISEPGINRITHYVDSINPEQDVHQLFLRVAESDCYVGTDSGISHIANLMGKPCFIIGGSADPMKTQYNLSLVYPVGRTDLLCYGCRHNFKGFRTTEQGINTFVVPCHNERQYECMKTLDIDLVLEELDNFLIKYDLLEKSENPIDN